LLLIWKVKKNRVRDRKRKEEVNQMRKLRKRLSLKSLAKDFEKVAVSPLIPSRFIVLDRPSQDTWI
jgi:hypothetical protein